MPARTPIIGENRRRPAENSLPSVWQEGIALSNENITREKPGGKVPDTGRSSTEGTAGIDPYFSTVKRAGFDQPWTDGSYMHSARAGRAMNSPGSSARMM